MSFSSEVKDEIAGQVPSARHCQTAELSAIIYQIGHIYWDEFGKIHIKIQTENLSVARKYFTLSKKTYNISNSISIRRTGHKRRIHTYVLEPLSERETVRLLRAVGKLDQNGMLRDEPTVPEEIVASDCCKRAFIRGSFLTAGSISNPERFYHLEMVVTEEARAEQLRDVVNSFGLDAKIVLRKKSHVVYLKEGDQLVDLLNVMEAHVSLMQLENVRILKEMRNSVNRQVNCDTANIHKTVSAAVKQAEDIELIRDTIGFFGLPEGLEEIAMARLEQPEASLKELGESLNPPVGKSGVNHRLRKLKEIADSLRANKEDGNGYEKNLD